MDTYIKKFKETGIEDIAKVGDKTSGKWNKQHTGNANFLIAA